MSDPLTAMIAAAAMFAGPTRLADASTVRTPTAISAVVQEEAYSKDIFMIFLRKEGKATVWTYIANEA
ncbi:hypothetical protein AB0B89_22900 [Sphaerisporangium sp. NPDC049002]|uniref:hypothetical protein n=1 Tax=Sphaerisporangium sp. NPDC049002 TaxID=3155392 RepID=UPI0033CF1DF5